MDKLRVAVIGLRFGMAHIEGAMGCGAEIAAICDVSREHLDFAGERYDIPVEKRFTDYRELLAREDIDAAIVAVPDQQHRELSCAFLRAGKHVLCEKPMALTLSDVRAMIRAADGSGRQLMVGQICRFTPAFRQAKALVDGGVLGDLYYLESEYAHDYMNTWITGARTPCATGSSAGAATRWISCAGSAATRRRFSPTARSVCCRRSPMTTPPSPC